MRGERRFRGFLSWGLGEERGGVTINVEDVGESMC